MSTARIITGDVREVLATLPDASVNCVVTSPPYWGLRSYLPKAHPDKAKEIGTERTHIEYVEKMVAIFREVRRVLRDDGTLWLNLGDSYAGSWGAQSRPPSAKSTLAGNGHVGGGPKIHSMSAMQIAAHPKGTGTGSKQRTPGVAAKNLLGIPWRVAFALQADGWFLRSEIVWSKPNPMPSSVTDRPTTAHEHVFMLTKKSRYFYDAAAIAEPAVSTPKKARDMRVGTTAMRGQAAIRRRGKNEETPDRRRAGSNDHYDAQEAVGAVGITRNKRTVWSIAPASFDDAHFAVMPGELARTCILAGSAGGGLVLDLFSGAGTVGVEALKAGRDFLGIELNPEYAEMARARIRDDAPLFNEIERSA